MSTRVQTLIREQFELDMEKIEQARLVYETIVGLNSMFGVSNQDDDDDDDDEEEIDRYIREQNAMKSNTMGVCSKGEIIDAEEVKILALKVMRNGLKKLL